MGTNELKQNAVLDKFEGIARHVTFKNPSIPVISPLLKDCVFDGKSLSATYLTRASREPVDFVGALDAARDMEVVDDRSVWIEIGPHPICAGFVRNWNEVATTFASARREEDSFVTLAATLVGLHTAGVVLTWQEWYRPYERALRLLPVASYKWNEKNYWIQLVGTWTLDKAFGGSGSRTQPALPTVKSKLRTSSIHEVLAEEVQENGARVSCIVRCDLKNPSLLPSVAGHEMNGYGVASSSIWADMAYTLGEHVYNLSALSSEPLAMNMTNLEVLHAQVVAVEKSHPHPLKARAVLDLDARSTLIEWYQETSTGEDEPFASCTIRYEDTQAWKSEWSRIAHLVSSRADELDRLATSGAATRLSHKMAYNLFENVVRYTEKYRGMQTVALADGEACAQVRLADDRLGTWHTPPHWFDSLFHIGGLVLNGGDGVNTRDFFYVTPGWDSCRILPRLAGGDRYRSVVRMAETGEPGMYAGDVYVLQGDTIVGMMGAMKFRRVPRVLMDRFFSPAAAKTATSRPEGAAIRPPPHKTAMVLNVPPREAKPVVVVAAAAAPVRKEAYAAPDPVVASGAEGDEPVPQEAEDDIVQNCLRIIARESGLEMKALQDDAAFVQLGVDSLMSLVLADKFHSELQLDVKSSVFLECTNILEFKEWLTQYC